MMKSTTSYLVTPWNVDSSNYEESYIFRDILSSNIADAARIAVIRSQMETKGVYDPEKVIDVTAYVNRAGTLPEQYVTARYYLEDLLKWKKFGFERNYMLVDENTFYADVPTYAEAEQVLAEESMVTADMAELYEDEPSNVYLEVLICRYLTVDGKQIQELVSNQSEYEQLCKNIEQAATQLYYNYEEYLDEGDYFNEGHSNFRYCIRMMVDGDAVYLSNVDITGLKDKNITERFEKNGPLYILLSRGNDLRYQYLDRGILCPGGFTFLSVCLPGGNQGVDGSGHDLPCFGCLYPGTGNLS